MAIMSDDTIKQIMLEAGVSDASVMDAKMEAAAIGTVYEKAAKTKNSIFWKLYKVIFRAGYERYLSDFKAMIPQLHHRYASGADLREHLKDVGLEEFLGLKARYLTTIKKKPADDLYIYNTDVFYIEETNPRRYKAIQNYEFISGETSCEIIVEAVAVGARFNLAGTNLIASCERSLTVESIGNLSVVPVQAGADPETEEMMRDRISAVKGTKIRLGVEDYYLNVLKTAPGVVDATLDDITPNAVMYYTIYGKAALSGESVSNAQAIIDDAKMKTDTCVVSGAQDYTLDMTITIDAAYDQSEITSYIQTFFYNLERGTVFEESLLSAYIYDQKPDLKGKAIRITPDNATLPIGSYFVPSITYTPWGS